METIQSQIDELRKRPGDCHAAAKTCVKLACTLDGAISWCNDGPTPISRPHSDIAKDAEKVMDRCTVLGQEKDAKTKKRWTRGQLRDSKLSRVVVNKGDCKKGDAGLV